MIERRAANRRHPVVAYFYCLRDPAQRERAEPEEILRAIVRQLVVAGLPIIKAVRKAYQRSEMEQRVDGSQQNQLSIDECVELISSHASPIIIIDGLDECNPSTRHELLNALARLASQHTKLFLSSRDDGDIKEEFKKFPNIFVDRIKNSQDIERFICHMIDLSISNKILLRGNVELELKAMIIEKLTEKAQGMYVGRHDGSPRLLIVLRFQWVNLQIQTLCRLKRAESVMEQLNRLPRDLPELYKSIYEQIKAHCLDFDIAIVEAAFSWLLHAQRQLTVEEFLEALSWSTPCSSALQTGVLLDLCCNLIVVNENSDSFAFAHLSVREYLEKHSDYTRDKCHSTIARGCLRYSQNGLASSTGRIYEYGCLYWPLHYEKVGVEYRSRHILEEALDFFASRESKFTEWAERANDLIHYSGLDSESTRKLKYSADGQQTPLAMICAFDFFEYSQFWEKVGQVLPEANRHLRAAACWGNIAMAEWLLQNGADINSLDRCSKTSLAWAVYRKDEGMVRLLIKKGASLDQAENGRTPLFWSIIWKDDAITKLLVDEGANCNLEDERGCTLLDWARIQGTKNAVELLLKKGVQQSNVSKSIMKFVINFNLFWGSRLPGGM